MHTYQASSRSAYQRSAVLTASQPQLVVMLYDGTHRFLAQAAHAMRERDVNETHRKLRRAEMIIDHLRTTLDMQQGGEVAVNLQRIYLFCSRHLNEARVKQDPERIEQVDGLLLELRESWAQLAGS
ncbi:MAG: flagellar export chaperone FliS [Solirubrobacteraceae bacterium]